MSDDLPAFVRRVETALDEFDRRLHDLERAPAFSMQEAIRQRRRVITRMREAGLSIERIAQATGAARTTVTRDLEAAAPQPPARVTGVDGRGYPSTHSWGRREP